VKNFKLSEFYYPDSMSEVVNIRGINTKNILLPESLKREKVATFE
jgi:hypothetical protein